MRRGALDYTQMKFIMGRVILTLGLGMLLVGQFQPMAHAQTPNQAALVVSYSEGVDTTMCVSFEEEEISGYELLRRSGLGMLSEPSGLGQAICRIDATGCNHPQEKCFCECQGQTCYYWSFWHLEGGTWTYSQLGSSLTTVSHGSVDGWVWGTGTIGQNANRTPPLVTFEEVCAPTPTPTTPTSPTPTTLPTVTMTPVATNTPTREPSTATPTPIPAMTFTPTPGPTPTPSPTPFVPPTIRMFVPDRPSLLFGENATLTWDVADSNRVLLRYPGGEEDVPAQGSKLVAPEMTTQYTLIAASPVGQAESVVTVEVNAVISAPTAEPTDAAELAQAVATDTSVPPAPSPTWTAPTPLPTDTLLPTNTPLPTDTPLPTATATPVPVEAPAELVAPAATVEDAISQVESPLIITVVVTPVVEIARAAENADTKSGNAVAPAVVPTVELLEPGAVAVSGSNAGVDTRVDDGAASVAVTGSEREFMVIGLAFVVLTPLLFAGIWAMVWFVWRRQQ